MLILLVSGLHFVDHCFRREMGLKRKKEKEKKGKKKNATALGRHRNLGIGHFQKATCASVFLYTVGKGLAIFKRELLTWRRVLRYLGEKCFFEYSISKENGISWLRLMTSDHLWIFFFLSAPWGWGSQVQQHLPSVLYLVPLSAWYRI